MAANITLKVKPSELKSSANKFQNKATEVKNKTQQMLNLIDGISGNVWSGDAQKAYKNRFNQLKGDMNNMYNRITEYVDDLNKIAQNYENTETSIQQTVGNLKTDVIK